MKYFVIAFALTCVAFVSNLVSDVFSLCVLNEDWPAAPCYDQGTPTKSELKEAWAPYYDYKGKEWMEMKKTELVYAILSDELEEWSRGSGVGDLINWNVYQYYSVFDNLENFQKPLHQIKHVDMSDVRCFDNLTLIQKYDGSPACVTESTKQKLIERDWATNEIVSNEDVSNYHKKSLETKFCTANMIEFLDKNSNIFDNESYSSPLDGDVLQGFDINPDDMVKCENELYEDRNYTSTN